MGKPDLSRRDFLWASAVAIALGGCGHALGPEPAATTATRGGRPTRRIVVIGGGITGLAIATDLVAKGFDPIVLEASPRAGGRVQTVRSPFPAGLYVEAGATHVVADPALLALAASVNVEIVPRKRPKDKPRAVALRGQKRFVSPPDPEPPPRLALTDDEKKLGSMGRLKKYFAVVDGVDPTAPLPDAIVKYDQVSAAAFLKEVGASDGAAQGLHLAFMPDEPLENISALALVREIANFFREVGLPGKGGRVAGGADRLPEAIAAALAKAPSASGDARVVYGAKVTRVEERPDTVRVVYDRAGTSATIEADRCVSTLPSTVLGAIAFATPLSADKQRAIQSLSLVSVTRVWLTADRRFWTDQGESGTVDTDSPLGNLRDETEEQEGTAGVLGAYVTGADARRLAAMTETDRAKEILAFAELSHPGLTAHHVGSASKCWDTDPLQRGAYAHFKPRELTTLVPALAKPEGRLHFAGDQTSYRPGFMHGALASARRVVEEIVRAS